MKRFPRSIGLALVALATISILVTGVLLIQRHHTTSVGPCLRYGAFSRSISFIIAERRGFFHDAGISVCYEQVKSSTQPFDALARGKYDLISTAVDNAVHRSVNERLPVSVLAGIDMGSNLSLVANHHILEITDLRGKAIAVDAPNSGFVFALQKILAENGLHLSRGDYTLQVIGGSSERYQALKEGKTEHGETVYATMLSGNLLAQSRTRVNLHDT